MIELHTGVPGSGKTLKMVEDLAALLKRGEKDAAEVRPVYVHGIPELALPHLPVPMKSVQYDKAGSVILVPDWEQMPDGSLVIIDECQSVFPPRSSQSKVPEHVAFLNVHRHRGFDVWITTQHPKLVDSTVRALVGRHKHFRRIFGMQRAIIYEWDECQQGLSGLGHAVKTQWGYPAKAYTWYKSAEIHTKQRFKKPWWIWALPLGPLLLVYFLPSVWTSLTAVNQGDAKTTKPALADAGQVAVIAATPPALQLVGYFREDARCFGVKRNGEFVEEPEKCRENLK